MPTETTKWRTPVPGDAHWPFYQHLLRGGVVHREDPLNGVTEDLTLAVLASRNQSPEEIQRYGYANLTIVEISNVQS